MLYSVTKDYICCWQKWIALKPLNLKHLFDKGYLYAYIAYLTALDLLYY